MSLSDFFDTILEFGFAATSWLQSSFPWLEGLMFFVSGLGTFEFYLALIPILYWCMDKRAGRYFLYILMASAVVNLSLKHIFHGPRPFWIRPELGLSAEASYGLPSGHVQMATVTYLFWANWVEKTWASVVAIVLIVLMVLSRIYLGVHFVYDTILGFVLGSSIVAVYAAWMAFGAEKNRNRILGQRLMMAVLIPLTMLFLYGAIRFIVGPPDLGQGWDSFVEAAEAASWEGSMLAYAGFFGMGIGFVLEQARLGFLVDGRLYQRILRYLVGMVGAIAIYQGLKILFGRANPTDIYFIALFLRFVRYLILGLWISLYAPMVFVKLGLAEAGGSEITHTL